MTLNAGGGERSRMGVGTIGRGSVRSYAAAAFGDTVAREVGAGLDVEGDADSALSKEPMGAVWLREG